MKRKTRVYHIGQATISMVSDVCDGQILDTSIYIGGELVCTVAGGERKEFFEALAALVEKYEI